MKNQFIFSVKGFFVVFLLACTLFTGCASLTSTPADDRQSQSFLVSKEAGKEYIKNPEYVKIQNIVNWIYYAHLLEGLVGCENISLGLQFILIEASPSTGNLIISLLAESSSSKSKFFKKVSWYRKCVWNAENFLSEMKGNQKFLKSLQDRDFEGFAESVSGYRKSLCDPEVAFQILAEFFLKFPSLM